MKATITIQMPSSCKECRFTNTLYHFGNMYFCTAVGSKDSSKNTEDETCRPTWCPLVEAREPDVKIDMKNVSRTKVFMNGQYIGDAE